MDDVTEEIYQSNQLNEVIQNISHGSIVPVPKERSPSIGKLAFALSKSQGEFPKIKRNKTVSVKMKSGGTYTFQYADLSEITESVKKVLSENELAVTHFLNGGGRKFTVYTRLIHSSGEFIESSIDLDIHEKDYQQIGSLISYIKRYQKSAILDLAADDDDDANIADGNRFGYKDKVKYSAKYKKKNDAIPEVQCEKGLKAMGASTEEIEKVISNCGDYEDLYLILTEIYKDKKTGKERFNKLLKEYGLRKEQEDDAA